MTAEKLPAIQFYPGDWKRDLGVQTLSLEERGFWFELILLMHESEEYGKLILNGQPIDADDLASIFRINVDQIQRLISKLSSKGVASIDPDTGAVCCRRMVRFADLRKKRAEAGRKGGIISASKKKAKSSPSSSTSSSTSTSVKRIKDQKDQFVGYTDEFESFWNAYPKKVGKRKAFEKFQELRHEFPVDESMANIVRKHCDLIFNFEDGGKWIPHPVTWLNQRRFEDRPVDPNRGKEGHSWDATEDDIKRLQKYASEYGDEFEDGDE